MGVRSPLFLSFTNYFFTSLIQDSNHIPLLIGDRGFKSHKVVHGLSQVVINML